MKKNTIGITLTIVSFCLLFPGIFLNIFELTLDTAVDAKLAKLSLTVLDQKRSILGTVSELLEKKRYLVGALIFLFSIVIPFLKGILVIYANTKYGENKKFAIFQFVEKIGKWSMADVLVVAVFLAYLATTSSGVDYKTTVSLMGMQLPIKINSLMKSSLGPGFWCFLAYCLCSLGAMSFFEKPEKPELQTS